MGMYAVDTADPSALGEFSDAARQGRAAATARRRQLSQGMQALNGAVGPADTENLQVNGVGALPPAPNGHGASNGVQAAPKATAVATNGASNGAANGVSEAHFGRAVSVERRRQLSQGKSALNGGGAAPAANDVQVNGAEVPAAASNGQSASNGPQVAPPRRPSASSGVSDAQFGRAVSVERRRQLSQGKSALNGAGAPPAAPIRQRTSDGTQAAPQTTAAATSGVSDAKFGRAVSVERRRQLSQGKSALRAGGDRTVVVAAPAAATPAPPQENLRVDDAASGREQARARRAEASRFGSAGFGRPQREGRVAYPPKVIVSPTQREQQVTGLRIGPGVQVTGDEAGAALPVSGTQYVPADGSAPAMGAGPKVGHVRTPQGLVVSGTTVRSKVPITGDEFGEHLRITGEADQKFHDDLTPRPDGTYRPTQFPRRADPHGSTAVALHPQVAASRAAAPGYALAATDGGLPVTGTAVGRSGRVTGNDAGVCRPITGDQYQDPSLLSTECGGIGGGTAPAAQLGLGRLDPATWGKVTVAQTWQGQRVTGPSLEYSPNVTGDEPGSCRPVTGTPYQGPSTAFGWCAPDERDPAARRLDPKPRGVAVTGDLPTISDAVTGTERGEFKNITGSSYYSDMRPAQPVGDDGATWQGFSVPVALARRLAGVESDGDRARDTDAVPASNVPGRISGSFAIGDGMVTGNNEFLFRPRLKRDARTAVAVTGEGEILGRTITGSPAAWAPNDKVTGTEGYIAAGRNPTQRGGGTQGWAGTRKFATLATPGPPPEEGKVTGRVGGSPVAAARVTVSGGAQG